MKLLLALVCLGALAFGQSALPSADEPSTLGDAARQARESKSTSSGKVYTNEDLPSDGGINVVGKTAPSRTRRSSQGDPVRDQKALDAKWHIAITQQKNRVADLERQLNVAQLVLARVSHYDPINPNPTYVRYKSQVDLLQKQLDDAKVQLADMQDEARKAGADKAYD